MISIIVPTYNNESTIERTLLSVIAQTRLDWELVVVDDCSTDHTPEILEKYKGYGERFKVVRNETNMGVGVSRKVGVDNSNGEFLTFLDSDDILAPHFLEMSMQLQGQHDSDIVYTSFTILYPQGVTDVIPAGDFIMEGEATTQLHFSSKLKFLTGKIFKRSIAEKIEWSPKRVGEDVQTLFFATYEADKVRSSSYSGYIHCFRQGSLLADAPYFYCYCGSTMAEHEIIDFLISRGDEKLWKYLLTTSWQNYQVILAKIKEGKEISRKDVTKNKEWWSAVKTWFRTHQKYVKQIL